MAADFQGQFAAAGNINFQQRVAAGLRAAALAIYGEANTITGHAARAAYALQIVQNPPLAMVTTNQFGATSPDKFVYAWASLLAAQGLDNGSTDVAIQSQIATDWNAMAGA